MAANFYERLSPEDALMLDRLAKLMIELREGSQALLQRHRVTTADDLLAKIRAGEVSEHPAYEDYLGVVSMNASHTTVRAELREYMLKLNAS